MVADPCLGTIDVDSGLASICLDVIGVRLNVANLQVSMASTVTGVVKTQVHTMNASRGRTGLHSIHRAVLWRETLQCGRRPVVADAIGRGGITLRRGSCMARIGGGGSARYSGGLPRRLAR